MLPLTNKKKQAELVSGILLVNKATGMTSHDVVDKVRRITGQRQVGHAGTLDPLASGLLVVCLGKATKVTNYLAGREKSYRAVVRLGRTSNTYDSEGLDESPAAVNVAGITRDRIDAVLDTFRGSIEQQVPLYSAVHVDGQRLHEKARRGEHVEAPSRTVTISSLTVVEYNSPDLTIDVTCSKGTYIRSLAHDIGQALGCGAYLHDLRRTAADNLTIGDALTLEDIASRWTSQQLRDDLLSIGEALRLPALIVDEDGFEAVSNGKEFKGRFAIRTEGTFVASDVVVIKNDRGKVLAIGTALVNSDAFDAEADRTVFKYARVLV